MAQHDGTANDPQQDGKVLTDRLASAAKAVMGTPHETPTPHVAAAGIAAGIAGVDAEAAAVLDAEAARSRGLGELPGDYSAPQVTPPEPVTGIDPLAPPLPERLSGTTNESPVPEQDVRSQTTQQTKEPKMNEHEQMNDAMNDMQNRSQEAYAKSSEAMGEMAQGAQGNMEALAESGKIFSNGMQELARNYVEDAKSVYEQMTSDLRQMAAVKSPTELLQLQGEIMRRNFDTMVSASSKNTERMMKLSNDAFAPISARMSVAADKISKAG